MFQTSSRLDSHFVLPPGLPDAGAGGFLPKNMSKNNPEIKVNATYNNILNSNLIKFIKCVLPFFYFSKCKLSQTM